MGSAVGPGEALEFISILVSATHIWIHFSELAKERGHSPKKPEVKYLRRLRTVRFLARGVTLFYTFFLFVLVCTILLLLCEAIDFYRLELGIVDFKLWGLSALSPPLLASLMQTTKPDKLSDRLGSSWTATRMSFCPGTLSRFFIRKTKAPGRC